MEELKILEIRKRISELQSQVFNLYTKHGYAAEQEELENVLKEINEREKITIAFIGQYSAGKSTLISALTGRSDIKIDADIATLTAKEYVLNDQLVLVDTPGLYTANKEHDDITIETIKKSDMLVYCITNELFDEITIKDYKKWVYEKNYRYKTILVINKMSREFGDYNELKKNYIQSINRALDPFNIEDVNYNFVDAKDYIEGINLGMDELIKLSRIGEFKENFNQVINERGVYSKLDTPIKVISHSIDGILTDLLDNKHDRNQLKLVNKLFVEVEETRNMIGKKLKAIIHEELAIIISYGNSQSINIGVEEFNFNEQEFKSLIEKTGLELNKKINSIIEEESEYLRERMEDIYNSNLVKVYTNDFKYLPELKYANEDETRRINNFEKIEEILREIGVKKIIDKHSLPFKIKTSEVSGEPLHKFVKSIGEKINYKFAPWEAVKVAKNIGKILGAVGVIVQVISIFKDATNDKEETEYFKLQKARQEFRTSIEDIVKDMELEYKKIVKEVLDRYSEILEELEDLKESSLNNLDKNNEFNNRLKIINDELLKLQTSTIM